MAIAPDQREPVGALEGGADGASAPGSRWTSRRRLVLPEELGVFAALVLLVVIVGTHNSAFVQPENLLNLVASSSFFGMIALALVFLLALGEIDLSVGWNFNFSAVIAAQAMTHGVDPWLAARHRHPLRRVPRARQRRAGDRAAPAGDHRHARHVLDVPRALPGREQVVRRRTAGRQRQLLHATVQYQVGEVPVLAIIFLALAIVLQVVLQRTRFGYRVQAIGSNPEAARLAGIPLARTQILVLVLVGAICGLSGVLSVGSFGAIDPNSGGEFMLTVIAAVIIGGTPLSGGSGTVIGALLRRADHRQHRERDHLLRHRRHLEHVRHGRGDHRRRRHRPGRQVAACVAGGAAALTRSGSLVGG